MATVSYSLANVVPEFTNYRSLWGNSSHERTPAVVSLEDGRFAIAYESKHTSLSDTFIHFELWSSAGTIVSPGVGYLTLDTATGVTSVLDPSITQLTDGRLLITWTRSGGDAPGIYHSLVNVATPDTFSPSTLLPGTGGADFAGEVMALQGGGWALVRQVDSSASNQNASLLIYNSTGALLSTVALGGNSAADEQSPAVTVLSNGNIAIAYEKEKVDNTDTFVMAIEIRSPTGSVVRAETTFDGAGSQNRNPAIVALPDGGFAVAYEDNQYGEAGASIAFFSASGARRGSILRVDTDGTVDRNLALTVLDNGFVYVTFTSVVGGGDIYSAVFDPATLQRVMSNGLVETQALTQDDSSVSVIKNGNIVTSWTDENATGTENNFDGGDDHVSIQIDRVVRTITGDATAETLTGDSLADIIHGLGGNDRLNGLGNDDVLFGGDGDDILNGGLGNDQMTGGIGNDTYYVDSSADQVIEFVGQGSDKVIASVSFALAAGMEVETLQTSSVGAVTAINLTGNEFVQTITGNAGDNILDGKGGADTMRGLAGNDTYHVDNIGDVIVEAASQGTNDRVIASTSYVVTANSYIEHLEATVGYTAINLTGNELSQTLRGNFSDNRLDGRGGVDTMDGDYGNDIYHVDNAGDAILEIAGYGFDTAITTVSYSLTAAAHVELVQTNAIASTKAMNLTGNEFAQTIVGNAGNNRIDGQGGADTMNGGFGNDTYIVDNVGDVVIELVGRGTDKVITSVSHALTANAEIETLQTSGAATLTNINLTGSDIGQEILGNNGSNRIDGKEGADTLRSFGGNDTFVFSTALISSNVDTIVDFDVLRDRFELKADIFTGLTKGQFISAAQFAANTSGLATTADHRIIYETDTGNLYFDADGNGAGARKHFAIVTPDLALNADDFFIG